MKFFPLLEENICYEISPNIKSPDGHFMVRAPLSNLGYRPKSTATRARCHLLLVIMGNPLEAWLVEQNEITSQLLKKHLWLSALLEGTSVMTGI